MFDNNIFLNNTDQLLRAPDKYGMRAEVRLKRGGDEWAFIVNPAAGNGFGQIFSDEMRAVLDSRNVRYLMEFTSGRGHATEIARSFLKKGYRRIVAVGGDGTASEAAQSLIGAKNVLFGAIPAGSGNDFTAILGFPERFTANEWDIFLSGRATMLDAGRCNDRYFVNGMGLGFDAQVARENYSNNNRVLDMTGRKSRYAWHIVKTIITYREIPATMTCDGRTFERKAFLNTIAIGRRLAGGFYLTPLAFADDGLFDVCIADNMSLAKRVRGLVAVIRGKHTKNPMFSCFNAKKLSFDFGREVPAHLDGEMYFNSKFDISITPSALRVIYNPGGPHYFNRPSTGS